MTIHDFGQQLAYSHSRADAPYWPEIYRQAFPDMATCLDLRHDGWHQRAGRDRAIVLTSGRMIYVDEKVRSENYDDILIEVWSQYPLAGDKPYPHLAGAVAGWGTKPLDCDFLAYAFERSQVCYLLPFLGIRAAWQKHGAMWRGKAQHQEGGFRWVRALNRTYATISIAVPTKFLQDCVNDALTVCWAAPDLSANQGDGTP
jgi:hypothetical protein